MPHAKTHNAQKISLHSPHIYVACSYQCAPMYATYVFAAGVAIACASAFNLYFS